VPTAAERVVSVPPTRLMSLAPRLELSPLRINRSPVSNHCQTLRPLHSTSSSLTVVSPGLIHRSLASPFTDSHLHHSPFQQASLDISSLLDPPVTTMILARRTTRFLLQCTNSAL